MRHGWHKIVGWVAVGGAALGLAGVVGGQVVIGGKGVVGTSITVATLQTGNVLSVTPAVSADRRYVGMAIDTQFSTLDGIDTFVLPTTSVNGGVVGNAGMMQGFAIRSAAFRPAQVGHVTFVDNDKALLAARVGGGGSMKLTGLSLKAAVQKLADATKENIVLGIRGLEQAGVDVNAPRDFSIAPGTVKEGLLAIVKTAMPETDLVITSEDKVITVTTQAQADQVLVTKTYYLEDLLSNVSRFVAGGTNVEELGGGRKAVPAMADFSSAVDVSKPPEEQGHAAPKGKVVPQPAGDANILNLITDTVRPEVWRNHGGKSDISLVGDKVIIRAPASVHAILDGPKVHNPNKVPMYVNYGGG